MAYPTFSFDEYRASDPELSFDEILGQESPLPEEYSAEDIKIEEQPDNELSLFDTSLLDEQELPVPDQNLAAAQQEITEVQTDHQDAVQLTRSRLVLLKKELSEIRDRIDRALELVEAQIPTQEKKDEDDQEEFIRRIDTLLVQQEKKGDTAIATEAGRIIEGVFDGQHMIGSDGNQYAVPQNYASKSKLVEGDALKLTITDAGSFLYKQIGPVERIRLVGTLEADPNHESYSVNLGDRSWRILTACVTYFRGMPNDEIVFLVPKDRASTWAAVENIIKKSEKAASRV